MEHKIVDTSERFAQSLDQSDQLAEYRNRFYTSPDVIYMDGNSLGLLSRDAEQSVLRVLNEWKQLAIGGWLEASPPWFYLAERLGEMMAPLVGADPDEVIAAGSTTVNLHAAAATFYRPTPDRYRILADELNFPSDIYALRGQAALHGYDPDDAVVLVKSRDGATIDERDVIAAMTDDIALAVLPSVLYRSGQLLDMELLAREARTRSIPIGFDLSHSAGSLGHDLNSWDADFAIWCTYKHLNAGPGSVGAMYVNRKHFDRGPRLAGWWGMRKDRQFRLELEFESAASAGGWQIGTACVLGMAALHGSLEITSEAGISSIRSKSLKLTDYLIALAQSELSDLGFRVQTPIAHSQRGGHVALEHDHALAISEALKARGVIPDFRPPNIVRLAPVALYSTFHEVWRVVGHLKQIVETKEYEQYAEVSREVV